MTLDMTGLKDLFQYLDNCCLHEPDWRPDEVEKVLLGIYRDYGSDWKVAPEGSNKQGWSDSESITVVKLKDGGGYGLLAEDEDYTGHGCQCGSYTGSYDSLEQLLTMGIPEGQGRDLARKELGDEQ